jgi:uncharacterized protein YidB (DUF937 family)
MPDPNSNTIALGVNSGLQQQGQGAANPLGAMDAFAGLQQKFNLIKLFQQEFAAKQRAGEIFATSPDPETAMRQIMQDKVAAPFAPAIVSSIRQGNLALTQLQGEQQNQAKSAWEGVLQTLPALAGDPDPKRFDSLMAGKMKLMSPAARERVQEALPSIRESIYGGLPDDPEAAKGQMGQRIMGLAMSAGVTPEHFMAANGMVPPQVMTTPVGPSGQPQTRIIGGPQGLGAGPQPAGGSQPQAATAPAGGPIVGPTVEERAFGELQGKNAGEIQSEMNSNAMVMPQALKRTNMIIDAMTKFQAGGGADVRTNMGQMLQGLKNAGVTGITDSMINKTANSSLSASELFNAEIKPLIVRQLTQDTKGAGAAKKIETEAYMNAISSNNDPETILAQINQVRNNLQIGYDMSNKFIDFKQKVAKRDPSVEGFNVSDYPIWYMRNFQQKDLPNQNAAGENIGQFSGEGIKGLPGKIKTFNPKTGKLE